MANSNNPFGLKQLGLNGFATNGQLSWRKDGILSSTPAIYCNDLIQRNAAGQYEQWVNGSAVSQAGGIFFGCEYYSTSQNTKVFNRFWPGSDAAAGTVTAQFIPFILTPAPLFVIQSGPAGIAAADIGQNADIVVGTGSTTTGFSGSYLSTIVTTATVPFTIVDLWVNWMGGQVGPGTQAGAYNWVVVAANNAQITGI